MIFSSLKLACIVVVVCGKYIGFQTDVTDCNGIFLFGQRKTQQVQWIQIPTTYTYTSKLAFGLLVREKLKRQTRISVRGEDLLDRMNIGRRSHVQPQIVLDRRLHDGLGRPFHCVVETRMDDVLFGSAGDALLEGSRRDDWNRTGGSVKGFLVRLPHGF